MMRKKMAAATALLLAVLLTGCAPDPHAGMVSVPDGTGSEMWVPMHRELAAAAFAPDEFSNVDGYIDYDGEKYSDLRGVDVSEYQGVIDWKAAADDGIQFAIIRAGYRGYTEGGLNEDIFFRDNMEGASAAGIKTGVYFFSQAVTPLEAEEEADYVLSLLDGFHTELPVFYDWERIGDSDTSRSSRMTGEQITDNCLAFCTKIEDAGYESGVYFYRSLGYLEYKLDRLKNLTFWVAAPGDYDDFYYEHSIWQYSYTGQVDGMAGSVDLNILFQKAA